MAGRGFRGLKAARALMKDGVAGAAAQVLGGGGAAVLGDALSSSRAATFMSLTGPGGSVSSRCTKTARRADGAGVTERGPDDHDRHHDVHLSLLPPTFDRRGRKLPNCGAPVDITLRTTAGGWTELPPIADMARIQVGHSQVEVSGRSVPAAEWTLAAGEGVYFPHHVLLWQEPSVELAPMSMHGAWKRMRAGLPLVMLTAKGPGRIAFSHDTRVRSSPCPSRLARPSMSAKGVC